MTMTKKQTNKIKEKKIVDFDFDKLKTYEIKEAVELVKKMSKAKFDESIEIHFSLNIDPKKGDQQIRSTVSLPHGTGKTVKIAAFVSKEKEDEVKKAGADFVGSEDLIEKIKKTEKTDFQIAVAEPIMMRNLAKIAKILGTRGLMPSPKNETVTLNPVKTVTELKKGKISFKNDDTANIHVVIGKISFSDDKILENYDVLLKAIQKLKPTSLKGIYIENISISSSMGKGIKINNS